MRDLRSVKLCVVGLGYVGCPLAVEFGKQFPVVGFDIDPHRISELRAGRDSTLELTEAELAEAHLLRFSSHLDDIRDANVFIVTVPTPVDEVKNPDLRPLVSASTTVGKALARGDVVIYESTVYPGATEEVCVPVLEQTSGLKFNVDFFVGYSPERINPGDKVHRLTNILKITSGSTPETADFVDALYRTIVVAGTHRAPSLKVAEAAKAIENTQRDLNIALVNECARILNLLNVDTEAVLVAAGTKWNFLPFRPGLVGGHCTGVDPFYLSYRSQRAGYHPELILAARRINDGMGAYAATQLVKAMVKRRLQVVGARVLIMGLSFKENCPDLRNTRVVDIVKELRGYEAQVDVYDPWADPADARKSCGIDLIEAPQQGAYDGIIIAVAHREFRDLGVEGVRALGKPEHVLYDLKYVFPAAVVDQRL